MPTEKKSYRFDMIMTVDNTDDETRTFSGQLIPNPERYDTKEIDGKKYLYDKLDDLLFDYAGALKQIAEQCKNMPIYYSKSQIENLDEYTKERIPLCRKFFEEDEKYHFTDKSENFLSTLSKDKMKFVILSIDLKGSTKMSQKISSENNKKIITLYLREMSALVPKYNGYVLKYVGDGFMAYFPEPNFVGMNDLAIDCAQAMRHVIKKVVNKILKERRLPEIKYRIGLDSGEAMVTTVGDVSTKQHKDLLGETMNLAAKIQSVAKTNQIAIGDTTLRNLYMDRRKWFKSYSLSKWKYKNKEGLIYPIHTTV